MKALGLTDWRRDHQYIEEEIHQIANKWVLWHAGDCQARIARTEKAALQGQSVNSSTRTQQRH
jgi:hypothetical protein